MIDRYERTVFYSEPDKCWVGVAPELRGCSATGGDPQTALRELTQAMRLWLKSAAEEGWALPVPVSERKLQGRILLRLPKDLHRTLVRQAAREGVSLNQYVLYQLTLGVGAAAPGKPRGRAA